MPSFREQKFWLNAKELVAARLSLTDDKADDVVIDERIRGDVEMRGSNLWVLMFAIFVASVGLNVNSTAVIIGAMLISPLMGPIIGMGYGAGINDFTLLRKSFKNLAIATVIGLLTSAVYFFISPLDTVQSELLARTTPTFWDVLIALFGGLAGIVAVTRKEKTNVIPGVAIATALMPPLCTAGFGLATGHWSYFFGAFYLYVINFVFISASSFLIVRIFHVAEKKYVDETLAKKAQRYIAIIVVATVLPSSYLAYQLVEDEIFKAKANVFVNEHMNFKNTSVAQVKIEPKTKEIKVFLVGEYIPQPSIDKAKATLINGVLKGSKLKVYQSGEHENVDISSIKADIVGDLYKNNVLLLESQDKQIRELRAKLAATQEQTELYETISSELTVLFPQFFDVILSRAMTQDAKDKNKIVQTLVVNASAKGSLSKAQIKRLEEWLKMRSKNENIRLIIRKS